MSCTEEQEQNQSHSKSAERDGNGLVMCCTYATSCTTTSFPQVDPLCLYKERKTERNMEKDTGEKDEQEQLDISSPGMTSTQQKPMVHFGQGLMCFET